MNTNELLYTGKAKQVYSTDDPTRLVVEYTDAATAFNGEKRGTIGDKGVLNNEISARMMQMLADNGVRNHFIARLDDRRQLVTAVDIVLVEVVVRNVVAGGLAVRTGLKEGMALAHPVVEFSYKDDELGDPLLNRDHISILGLATPGQLDEMRATALKVNKLVSEYMAGVGILLVDFKLEFGVTAAGDLILADEISPDTCRFWDIETGHKLDKDRFRRDLGGVEEAYAELLRRLPEPARSIDTVQS